MKILNLLVTGVLLCCSCSKLIHKRDKLNTAAGSVVWRMVFSDEFNTNGTFDARKWRFCERRTSAWSKYLTSGPAYAQQDGANLILKMDNAVIAGDDVPYHSGGIQTAGKFSIRYGKIEVRAKFKAGRGSWPAIWMMPELPSSYGPWPNSGEIDIMEHVNNEIRIHQTIHNGSVTNASGASTATHAANYKVDDYNTYSIIWSPDAIEFYVNDLLQYTYAKAANASSQQWPFDQPFYLILNQAGGAGWPGPITEADLPFELKVDWVRMYKPL
ncbi:glycoside hydrolase family 16 protein [Pedobacter sp. N36a]|uniref:glycoside hydrolase family 16 protein n=1 Tax=Pedobacter sp. N36a TaxID=2767996 RepID=UPI001657392A|nr:glycoside hydrolase family 16 protein [Pedobacter sp. N36a]MBC8987997.1 glycoside hydrolase family 16 protein [Pedobacter sp. N36a]